MLIKQSGNNGVHPSKIGYKRVADRVFEFLSSNQLLSKYWKIMCFGDSITFWVGAKGGSTHTGDDYPSFLHQRIADLACKYQRRKLKNQSKND
ncbi:hypothetical protein ACT3CE_05200 [Marinifilum sp. RC60d5]|uniref:hypothetical protein n=1 Tax=Marinifilum sp. RC60d5 TaxID=3458414 RepID=UPI0040350F5D